MVLLKNGYLYNMAGIEGELKDILIDNGKVLKIGQIDASGYPGVKVINLKKKFVMPGLVDAHCHVGIYETIVGWAGLDVNETTNPITPELRAIDAINPFDDGFNEAIKGGVTTVVTGPGSANVIGGTFCAIKTAGKTIDEMIVVPEVAMKMALGENPKRVYGGKSVYPATRMATAAILRDSLQKAKEYKEKKDLYIEKTIKGEEATKPEFNQKWESLSRVFEGMPVKIHCHQGDDIMTAIRISEEFGLNSTLDHCTEGYLLVDELVKHHKKCILGPIFTSKSKYEVKNKSFKSAKVLFDNNVEFSIMTDHPVIPLEYTLTQLGLFVKEGLPYLEALKAVTINSAKIAGISDRVGSIEVGKDADIIVFSKDPLAYDSHLEMVMINGKVVL